MAQCGDLETLNITCSEIKDELQKSNAWESSKSKCMAMKIAQKDLIDSFEDADFEEVVEVAETEEVTVESEASKEFLDETEEDVPFE